MRFADRIAYLTHDALDAIRAGILSRDALPPSALERFGEPGRAWIGEMIEAVVDHSLVAGEVAMDGPTLAVMNELRDFMFERVYQAPSQREQQERAIELLRALMAHHTDHPDEIPASYRQHGVGGGPGRRLRGRHDRPLRPGDLWARLRDRCCRGHRPAGGPEAAGAIAV